jgi:type II secretory pathway predicted ATPase ExeA
MRNVENRYGLARRPFTKDIDVEDLYPCDVLKGHQARLKAAVEGHSCAVVTGDPGTGKTFLLRALEKDLHPARYKVTYVHNATITRRDFYRQLSMVLGLEPKAHPSALFRQVQTYAEDLADAQKIHPLLVLDDAQLLPMSVLEHLHVLLNFRRDSKAFLSVLLIGLPELRERLARNVLASLSSRLPVRIQVEPFDAAQVGSYLRHRMKVAGCAQEVFSEEAALCIREASGGILRKIDLLAWACLEVGSERKSSIVDGALVQAAVQVCAEALR